MWPKNSIRRQFRERRDAIDDALHAAATEQICAGLLKLDVLRDAQHWFVYVSANSEVGTHELIRTLLSRGDIVIVPRVTGPQEMVAQQITSFTELRLSEFGILAPAPGEAYQGGIDACVCPGIAFSEQGDRLGSGRGYYDRFLAIHSPRLVIGLAFECQLVGELPTEPHDRPMDWLVTERRVIQTNRASR